jgi:hypothetical protein
MADKEPIEFPHILKKPEGRRLRVENQEDYDRAVSEGWSLDVPDEPPAKKTTTTTTETVTEDDPEPVQGPAKEVETLAPKEEEAPKAARKSGESQNIVLDGTVADVAKHVETVSDIRALQELKRQENKNAKRVGVLDAIDARIEELKG